MKSLKDILYHQKSFYIWGESTEEISNHLLVTMFISITEDPKLKIKQNSRIIIQ